MKTQHAQTTIRNRTVSDSRRGGIGLWMLAVAVLGSLAFSSSALANGGQWGGPKTIRRAADVTAVERSADADQLVRL